MKKTAAKGHVKKHSKAVHHKHHVKHAKHHPVHHHKAAAKAHGHVVHTKAKHPAHAKATGLALAPGDVACCGAEALAASLRLQGLPVSDQEMLDLFWQAGGHPDKGLPIPELLEAAAELGLGGVRLTSFVPASGIEPDPLTRPPQVMPRAQADLSYAAFLNAAATPHRLNSRVALILGLELPGPHAVLATPEGWWSWGGLSCPWCDFPDAVIEEAWSVSWAVAA